MSLDHLLDRRQFLRLTAAAGACAAGARAATSETLVADFHRSLSDDQKRLMAFPFDHPLRSKVDANWNITQARVGQTFNADQQAMIREIFVKLHDPEFVDPVLRHLSDDSGGIENYSVALFGEPGTGAFEFVLTGRHCTARCDGDSVAGAAFGGPIFYGHQAGSSFTEDPHHPNNIYWFQALRANEVFAALDGRQRELALLNQPRPEKGSQTVSLKHAGEKGEGLPVSDMSADQRALVDRTLDDLLLPFRQEDRAEAHRLIAEQGGVESLAMAFYRGADLGGDGVWDVWQLESPTMIWHFRGSPHVHVWVNIRENPGWRAET